MENSNIFDGMMGKVRTESAPSQLRITDLRITNIDGAPKHCILLKLFTNQGLMGYGELRDASSATYALMLKSRLLGENPCNVDRLFRRIRQFGGMSRQGGGVSAVEIALLDLAGKAYGIPVYQLLGGQYRSQVRMYCDTDVEGKHSGTQMGEALKRRIERGYTFLKMDLGMDLLFDEPGCLNAPLGFLEDVEKYSAKALRHQSGSIAPEVMRGRHYETFTIPHHATGIHLTERGIQYLVQYVREVRDVIGYEVPLAIDHLGHLGLGDCIRLARQLEPYNIAWLEDVAPWQYTEQYVKIANATTIPICTGEDIYLHDTFRPLLKSGGVSVVHPDVLTIGGAMEIKKLGDLCEQYGAAMAIHMAESPIGCMAAVHAAAALPHILAVEHHSTDIPWWNDLAMGIANPLVQNGFIQVPDTPGLGISELNEELIREHLHSRKAGYWEETSQWDEEWSNDRVWS